MVVMVFSVMFNVIVVGVLTTVLLLLLLPLLLLLFALYFLPYVSLLYSSVSTDELFPTLLCHYFVPYITVNIIIPSLLNFIT